MITQFNTHYEISPYKQGDLQRLEDDLSVWDRDHTTLTPCAYTINDDTLYIPKGVNVSRYSTEKPVEYPDIDDYDNMRIIHPLITPRNKGQEDLIDFLTGENEFSITKEYPQLLMDADTGVGKTTCTLFAATKLGMKTLIITHVTKIKRQWMSACVNQFTFDDERMLDIEGSKYLDRIYKDKDFSRNFDIFFVCHKTLQAWLMTHGANKFHAMFKNMKIGLKVIDEAHLHFKNIMFIDFFTNTYKTIYLTATAGKSQKEEDKIYQQVFKSCLSFGSGIHASDIKHVNYLQMNYKTKCTMAQLMTMRSFKGYGIDIFKFAKYMFFKDKNNTAIQILKSIMDKCRSLEGKILIFVPLIDATEYVADYLRSLYPDKTVSAINSRHSDSENENSKKYADIIISTIAGTSVGLDIKGLRVLICMEPYSSKITAKQLTGRLRPYINEAGEQLDTYYFDFVTTDIPVLYNYWKGRYKTISTLVKSCTIVDMG
jgi:superfamily II DNA or RNA helicase